MPDQDTVVCIATYRRPAGLSRCLENIARMHTDRLLRVIVADNDADEAAGIAICGAAEAAGYPYPITSVRVAERGISQARNALVAEAIQDPRIRFIAMIDDDEWPEGRWLMSLLDVQQSSGADVVGGPVSRVFAKAVPNYLATANLADFASMKSGPVDIVDGTCNVLISADLFRSGKSPWFDPAFGLLGGEDTDFFLGLKLHGARFAWAPGAVVFEEMPGSRSSVAWMLQRAYRFGNTYMLVSLKHRPPGFGFGSEVLKIAGTLAFAAGTFGLFFWHPARRFEAARLVARVLGKLAALLGHRHAEYSAIQRHER